MLTVRQAATALTSSLDVRGLRRSTTDQIVRQERRAHRFARDQEVRALRAQSISKRLIAQQLHLSRTTVIRYLRATAFPEHAQARRVSLLDPYVASLQKRWDAGCHNGVKFKPWAFQAHNDWFQTRWCCAASAGSVDRQSMVDIRRC